MTNKKFSSLSDIIKNKSANKKAAAYQWQELALKVIKDLNIPDTKRSSIFKICKDYHQNIVLRALNDTKELCPAGESWKYFFKIIDNIK